MRYYKYSYKMVDTGMYLTMTEIAMRWNIVNRTQTLNSYN